MSRILPPRSPPRRLPYAEPGIEPPFEEARSDPVVCAVMARDGVTAAEVRRIVAGLRLPPRTAGRCRPGQL
ncbi:MAG: hypothetical protein KGL11_05100 [Alphaproteobacteria bacterium]|nr:hypothetical protein [Alphaproteobacteria bacterium]